MEGIRESGIESIIEDLQISGKVQRFTSEESSRINEKIDNNMRKFKMEFRKLEFESKIAAEKILLR